MLVDHLDDDLLDEFTYHRWMESLRRRRPDLRPVDDANCQAARKLVGFVSMMTNIYFRDNSRYKVDESLSISQRRILDASASRLYGRKCRIFSEFIKYFLLYYCLVKSPIVIVLQHRLNWIWYPLQELLGTCANHKTIDKLEFPFPAGPLLLNGDPTRNNFRLHLTSNDSRLRLAENEYVCRPDSEEMFMKSLTLVKNEPHLIGSLQVEMKQARDALKSVGNNYLNYNIVIEYTLLGAFPFALVVYFLILISESIQETMDFGLYKTILGMNEATEVSDEIVRCQVNELIRSSRLFAEESCRMVSYFQDDLQASKIKPAQKLLARTKHQRTVQMLRLWAFNGKLQPFNKTRSSMQTTIQNFINSFILLVLGSLPSSLSLGFHMHIPMFSSLHRYKIEWDLMGTWFGMESLLYLTLIPIIVNCEATYWLTNFSEQFRYLRFIRHSIEDCRKRIILLSEGHSFGSLPVYEMYNKALQLDAHSIIDNELLEMIIKYRIFLQQLKPVWFSIKLVAVGGAPLTIMLPMIAIFYNVYVDTLERAKIIMICVLFISTYDSILITICRFTTVCEDIFREFYKLLARSIQFAHLMRRDSTDNSDYPSDEFIDSHVVHLMRRELEHFELTLERHTMDMFGLKIAYPVLMSLHFWLGLIVVLLYFFDFRYIREIIFL